MQIRRSLLALSLLSLIAAAPLRCAPLRCAGLVAPGLAYPDANGGWHGAELAACDQWAARLHREPAHFSPILQASDAPKSTGAADLVFLPAGAVPPGFRVRSMLADDYDALLVPVASPARRAADLAGRPICVEPGSAEESALAAFFTAHHLRLREFVFQEVDEMRDAYLAGRCSAIVSPVSLLAGLRGNARPADRILPDHLGRNPIMIATSPALRD